MDNFNTVTIRQQTDEPIVITNSSSPELNKCTMIIPLYGGITNIYHFSIGDNKLTLRLPVEFGKDKEADIMLSRMLTTPLPKPCYVSSYICIKRDVDVDGDGDIDGDIDVEYISYVSHMFTFYDCVLESDTNAAEDFVKAFIIANSFVPNTGEISYNYTTAKNRGSDGRKFIVSYVINHNNSFKLQHRFILALCNNCKTLFPASAYVITYDIVCNTWRELMSGRHMHDPIGAAIFAIRSERPNLAESLSVNLITIGRLLECILPLNSGNYVFVDIPLETF